MPIYHNPLNVADGSESEPFRSLTAGPIPKQRLKIFTFLESRPHQARDVPDHSNKELSPVDCP